MAGTLSMRAYRTSLIGAPDPLMRRALKISGAVGLGFLAAVLIAPHREVEITSVEQVPERFAKLILEEPKARAPVAPSAAEAAREAPTETVAPPPVTAPPVPKRAARRSAPTPKLAEDRGQVGRERAQKEVKQQLASVTESLSAVVGELSTALASTDDGAPERRPSSRRRRTRSGRDAAQLAGVGAGIPTTPTDAAGSALASGGDATGIAIEEIGDLAWSDEPGGSSGAGGAGDGRSEYRSDRSLLSVVRRYAPGIQYCYDNELKKQPGLGGKLVVGLTVAPSGRVTDVVVVQDTVGSAALVACATAQIEAWKFPEIPEGVVTFRAPFVFTPPE